MARPQAENGHIDIAHEIAEAFARTSLTRTESRVLWAILRKTWGWHKKLDRISLSQFQAMTGDDKHNLHDALRSLTLRGIIVRGGKGQRVEYGIQKDYEQWKPLHPSPTVTHGIIELTPAQGLTKTVVPVTNRPLYPSPTKPLYPSPTTKEKKETIQKKKTNKGGELPKKKTKTIEQAFEDNKAKFPELDMAVELQRFKLWWDGMGKTPKVPALAVFNWLTIAKSKAGKANGQAYGKPTTGPLPKAEQLKKSWKVGA